MCREIEREKTNANRPGLSAVQLKKKQKSSNIYLILKIFYKIIRVCLKKSCCFEPYKFESIRKKIQKFLCFSF